MLSTSLLKGSHYPLHPPLSVDCSRGLLSSEHCRAAGILARVLHLAAIPYPASSLDRRASRASPVFGASWSCSPTIRVLSFSCLLLAKCKLTEDAEFHRLGGRSHVHGRTPFLARLLSFISPLCSKRRYLCAVSGFPFLFGHERAGRDRAAQELCGKFDIVDREAKPFLDTPELKVNSPQVLTNTVSITSLFAAPRGPFL